VHSNGSYTGVVVGQVTVTASDLAYSDAGQLVSLTFSVSGVSNQSYSWQAGTNTRTSGATVPTFGGSGSSFSFWFDETTGTETISVSANYQNASTMPTTVNVNIVKPTVTSFQGKLLAFSQGAFSSDGISQYGLSMGSGFTTPGATFSGQVNNNTPFSGQFGIIQLTKINRQVKTNSTTYTQNSIPNPNPNNLNGVVLDNAYGYDGVDSTIVTFGGNSSTGTVGPNSTTAVPPAGFVQRP
jgi:hypothetical protein